MIFLFQDARTTTAARKDEKQGKTNQTRILKTIVFYFSGENPRIQMANGDSRASRCLRAAVLLERRRKQCQFSFCFQTIN